MQWEMMFNELIECFIHFGYVNLFEGWFCVIDKCWGASFLTYQSLYHNISYLCIYYYLIHKDWIDIDDVTYMKQCTK